MWVDLEGVQRIYGGQDVGDIITCLFKVFLHQVDKLTHEDMNDCIIKIFAWLQV